MNRYLFIESRDPFESRDTQFVEETATALKQRGHDVTVFLVQNGVLAARQNGHENYLARLAESRSWQTIFHFVNVAFKPLSWCRAFNNRTSRRWWMR